MADNTPSPEQATQREAGTQDAPVITAVSSSGKRQAFQELKRQLSEQDLSSPGTQKLILEMLLSAETERDDLKEYVARYHAADKNAAVLSEKLKSNHLNEVLFASGIGIGCAIIGLSPFFWSEDSARGPICLMVGAVLVLSAAIGRILFK